MPAQAVVTTIVSVSGAIGQHGPPELLLDDLLELLDEQQEQSENTTVSPGFGI